jgi:hypothetical protein
MIVEFTMGIPTLSDEWRLQIRKSVSGAASGQSVQGSTNGFEISPPPS